MSHTILEANLYYFFVITFNGKFIFNLLTLIIEYARIRLLGSLLVIFLELWSVSPKNIKKIIYMQIALTFRDLRITCRVFQNTVFGSPSPGFLMQ